MPIIRLARDIFNRFHTSLELWKYTPYTFAEYLRKHGVQVGEHCFIVSNILIGIEPWLVKIGNHVAIASEVSVMTHDGAAWLFRDEVPDLQVYGPVVIGDNCFIGHRAIICPNVRIGENSIVAAGSLVIADVPANSVVMGVPARQFGSLKVYRDKCLQRWAQQRPPGVVIEPGETWWNSRHMWENRERLREHLLSVFHDDLKAASTEESEPACIGQSSRCTR